MGMQTAVSLQQRPQGMSTGAKVAIGLCVVFVVIVVVIAVLVLVGVYAQYTISHKIAQYESELKAKGYTKTVDGVVLVREPPMEPTLYKGATVTIQANCPTNIAILAMTAEIQGTVEGRVCFRGVTLVVKPKAVLKGGLDAVAMTVVTNGVVCPPFFCKPLIGQRAQILGGPVRRASG